MVREVARVYHELPPEQRAATAIFAFLLAWNELLFSLVLSGRDTRTLAQLPLTFSTDRGTEWGMVMAAGSLTLLPVIAFALLGHRRGGGFGLGHPEDRPVDLVHRHERRRHAEQAEPDG